MMRRCYTTNPNDRKKFKAYDNCTVAQEWHIFDNFYDWVQEQPNHNIKNWTLDKDIKHKNNTIYSPDTCYLVPLGVNMLFETRKDNRGDYPIGVTYSDIRTNNPFAAICRNHGKYIVIGYYKTQEEAFMAYKNYKENHIREVAEEELKKGTISNDCYNSMINYIVEITD